MFFILYVKICFNCVKSFERVHMKVFIIFDLLVSKKKKEQFIIVQAITVFVYEILKLKNIFTWLHIYAMNSF